MASCNDEVAARDEVVAAYDSCHLPARQSTVRFQSILPFIGFRKGLLHDFQDFQ
jgi:hypothetical protein